MSKGTVLIVEDEKPLRDVYEIILTTAGYTVSTAINGKEGLDAVERAEPNFVLLDVFMPVMGGLEFMRAVKPETRKDMSVVVFSNNSDSGVREEVCKLGAKDVILKADLTPSGLVDLVATYLP